MTLSFISFDDETKNLDGEIDHEIRNDEIRKKETVFPCAFSFYISQFNSESSVEIFVVKFHLISFTPLCKLKLLSFGCVL